MVLGVIGVGNMGAHVAGHLAAANGAVLVYDRSYAAVAGACRQPGVQAAPTLLALAEQCDGIITMLPGGDIVEQVMAELWPALRPGMLVIDMSTSHPKVSRKLAEGLRPLGVAFADAPVSGGIYAARKGELTVYLGSDAEHVERARQTLRPVAGEIFHMGAPGSGHVMKVLNNMVSMATLVLTTEAVTLGRRQGLEMEQVVRCLNAGSARSYATEIKYPRAILSGTFDTLGPMRMLYKDVNIALDLAESAQVATPTCQAATELWKVAMSLLGPERDQTEIYRFFCRMHGLEE